jgi:hypothetical protein
MTTPDPLADFQAVLLGALRDAPAHRTVEITTAEGRELLFYGPGPDHADGGVLLVPAVLLSEESQ